MDHINPSKPTPARWKGLCWTDFGAGRDQCLAEITNFPWGGHLALAFKLLSCFLGVTLLVSCWASVSILLHHCPIPLKLWNLNMAHHL